MARILAKRFKRKIGGRVYDLSPKQQQMLRGSHIAASTAQNAVGRNFRNVMNGLVTQGLMYAKGRNVWRRTVIGHVVNNTIVKELAAGRR